MILERAALAGLLSGLLLPGYAAAQVLKVAEMSTDVIRGLDRQRTVVIFPGGILEQHGPYLPSYSDGYYGERMARDLAEAVAGRPGWTALVFPPLALGALGANEIGGKRSFPGTFTVRAATLRAIYMDLASQLRLVSPEALAENGLSVHAGLLEQSNLLFLRPDLVPPAFRQAPSVTATSFEGLVAEARRPEWPGYFGAPRHASAAVGASFYREQSDLVVAAAMRILDGAAGAAAPRYSDEIIKNPVVAQVVSDSLARDRELEARQEAWLKKQSPWPPGPRR